MKIRTGKTERASDHESALSALLDDHEAPQAIIDSIDAAIYITDAAGRVTHFNRAAVELSGRIPEPGSDQWCVSWKLYHPNGLPLPHDECPMAIALKEGRVVRGTEIIVERPDGTRSWVTPFPTPLRDRSGRIVGGINLLIDVTERKRAQRLLTRLGAEQSTLYRFTDALQRATSFEAVYEAALDAIIGALACQRAAILLFSADGVMRFVDARGLSDAYRRKVEGHSPWQRGTTQATPIVIGDVEASDLGGELKQVVRKEGIGGLAFIPLIADGELIGKFMVYFDEPHDFTGGEMDLATSIARQLAFGVSRLQSERARAASEEVRSRLAAIVESSNDAIVAKDLDGTIMSWNAAAERLYGYTALEMIGQPAARLYPPEHAHEEESILQRIRAGDQVGRFDTVRMHKSGQPVQLSVTVSPVRDGAGRIVGAASVAHDVGEAKAHERELARSALRYRSLVDASGAIVYSSDSQAQWHAPNPAWEAYTGQTFEQYRGHGWANAIHPEDRERIVSTVLRSLADGEVWYGEGRLWHAPTRSYRYQEARSVPIRDVDGRVIEWVGTCLDIHARKVAEQAVRDADRRKDEFLAVLAHELRNPLSPIASGLQILRMPTPPSTRLATLDTMDRQLHHLVRLIDDLMDVARITRGTIELRKEELSAQEAVSAAVDIVRDSAEAHGHRMELELPSLPIPIVGDRVRLTQIVANLLSNAIKYTPRGGLIRVIAEEDGREACVKVIDNGSGISDAMRGRIFEMFARADRSIERLAGGLGIGLSLSRRLAQLHGGTVECASEGEGRGSTFTLRLPLSVSAPSVLRPGGDRRISGPRRKVLVVDDNHDALNMLAALLEGMGHDVEVAHDGHEALRKARANAPDVMLLDLGMPPPDGFEVAEQVRRMPGGSNIRIVAVTGWGQDADRRRTRECGFDSHMVKPLSADDVARALAHATH